MTDYQQAQKLISKVESGKKLSKKEASQFEKLKKEYGLSDTGMATTIKALAEILGVSRTAIYDWKKEGMPIEPDGTYDPEKIMEPSVPI